MDTHHWSRINQCLASWSPFTIIIACNFISPFRDRIVKIDGGGGNCGNSKRGDIIGAYVKIWRFIFSSPHSSLLTSWFFNQDLIENFVFFKVKIFSVVTRRNFLNIVEKIKLIVDPFRENIHHVFWSFSIHSIRKILHFEKKVNYWNYNTIVELYPTKSDWSSCNDNAREEIVSSALWKMPPPPPTFWNVVEGKVVDSCHWKFAGKSRTTFSIHFPYLPNGKSRFMALYRPMLLDVGH